MQEKLNEYIEKITSLFLQYGIKSMSTNDIAVELGISKKTLYQLFNDKADIVDKAIGFLKTQMQNIFEEYNNTDLNVIEKEVYQRKKHLESCLKIKPTFIYDLKKFYPQIFEGFKIFRTKLIQESTIKFIEVGKNQGLLREDIDADFMVKLSITLTFAIFHPELDAFSESDLSSKHYSDQFFIYHMNGICSEKGRIQLNQLLKSELLS